MASKPYQPRSNVTPKMAVQKLIAFFLLISFTLLNTSQNAFALPVSVPSSHGTSDVNPMSIIDSLSLPEELGLIQEIYIPKSTVPKINKLVIYVQDAHANYDSETNVKKLIQFFQGKYQLPLVLLEGGEGKLDSLFFKSFPDKQAKEKLLTEYLKNGDLQGGEAASILSENDSAQYYGIENQSLYNENRKVFIEASNREKDILNGLKEKEAALNQQLSNFTPNVLRFVKEYKSFHNDENDFLKYLASLKEIMPSSVSIHESYPEIEKVLTAKENENHFKGEEFDMAANRLIDLFKSRVLPLLSKEDKMKIGEMIQAYQTRALDQGSLANAFRELSEKVQIQIEIPEILKPAVKHAATLSSIKGTKLFDELEALEDKLRETLPATDQEREVLESLRQVDLLKQFAKLEITHKQWNELQRLADSVERIEKTKEAQSPSFLSAVRPALNAHFRFYELALERDEALFKNMQAVMEKEKAKISLITTGGFHQEGIKQKLKENNIPFILISPKINQIGTKENYMNAMQDKRSFMKYFKGSLWDALAQDYAAKLAVSLNEHDLTPQLKRWRDSIIQNSIAEGRITQATSYTKYVDALIQALRKEYAEKPDTSDQKPGEAGNWQLDSGVLRQQLEHELDSFLGSYFNKLKSNLDYKFSTFSEALKNMWQKNDFTKDAVQNLLRQMNTIPKSNLATQIAVIDDRKAPFGQFDIEAQVKALGSAGISPEAAKMYAENSRAELRSEPSKTVPIALETPKITLSKVPEAASDLAKAQTLLVQLLQDKATFADLVAKLMGFRNQFDYTYVQKSEKTPLEYWDDLLKQGQVKESDYRLNEKMTVIPTTESFRRHILKIDVGGEKPVYLQLKIPGDKDSDGLDRSLVSESDFKVPNLAWEKFGTESRFSRPVAMVQTTGTIENYYGKAGESKTFNNEKPFRVVAFEYIDGKRLQFSKGSLVEYGNEKVLVAEHRLKVIQALREKKEGKTIDLEVLKREIILDASKAAAQVLEVVVPFYVARDTRRTNPEWLKTKPRNDWTQDTDLTPSNASLGIDGRIRIEGDFDNSTVLRPKPPEETGEEADLTEGAGKPHYFKGPYDFNPRNLSEGSNQVERFLLIMDQVSYFISQLMNKFGLDSQIQDIETKKEPLQIDLNREDGRKYGVPYSAIMSARIGDNHGNLSDVFRVVFPDVNFDAIPALQQSIEVINQVHSAHSRAELRQADRPVTAQHLRPAAAKSELRGQLSADEQKILSDIERILKNPGSFEWVEQHPFASSESPKVIKLRYFPKLENTLQSIISGNSQHKPLYSSDELALLLINALNELKLQENPKKSLFAEVLDMFRQPLTYDEIMLRKQSLLRALASFHNPKLMSFMLQQIYEEFTVNRSNLNPYFSADHIREMGPAAMGAWTLFWRSIPVSAHDFWTPSQSTKKFSADQTGAVLHHSESDFIDFDGKDGRLIIVIPSLNQQNPSVIVIERRGDQFFIEQDASKHVSTLFEVGLPSLSNQSNVSLSPIRMQPSGVSFNYKSPEKTTLRFGADHDNDIVFLDPSPFVSKTHGRIEFSHQNGKIGFKVIDSSEHGTQLIFDMPKSSYLSARAELRSNDEEEINHYLESVFEGQTDVLKRFQVLYQSLTPRSREILLAIFQYHRQTNKWPTNLAISNYLKMAPTTMSTFMHKYIVPHMLANSLTIGRETTHGNILGRPRNPNLPWGKGAVLSNESIELDKDAISKFDKVLMPKPIATAEDVQIVNSYLEKIFGEKNALGKIRLVWNELTPRARDILLVYFQYHKQTNKWPTIELVGKYLGRALTTISTTVNRYMVPAMERHFTKGKALPWRMTDKKEHIGEFFKLDANEKDQFIRVFETTSIENRSELRVGEQSDLRTDVRELIKVIRRLVGLMGQNDRETGLRDAQDLGEEFTGIFLEAMRMKQDSYKRQFLLIVPEGADIKKMGEGDLERIARKLAVFFHNIFFRDFQPKSEHLFPAQLIIAAASGEKRALADMTTQGWFSDEKEQLYLPPHIIARFMKSSPQERERNLQDARKPILDYWEVVTADSTKALTLPKPVGAEFNADYSRAKSFLSAFFPLAKRAELRSKDEKPKRDYYKFLGVPRNATTDQIKRAFRKLALEFHPDQNPVDKKQQAEEKFKEAREAFEVLTDTEKRTRYDQFDHEDVSYSPKRSPRSKEELARMIEKKEQEWLKEISSFELRWDLFGPLSLDFFLVIARDINYFSRKYSRDYPDVFKRVVAAFKRKRAVVMPQAQEKYIDDIKRINPTSKNAMKELKDYWNYLVDSYKSAFDHVGLFDPIEEVYKSRLEEIRRALRLRIEAEAYKDSKKPDRKIQRDNNKRPRAELRADEPKLTFTGEELSLVQRFLVRLREILEAKFDPASSMNHQLNNRLTPLGIKAGAYDKVIGLYEKLMNGRDPETIPLNDYRQVLTALKEKIETAVFDSLISKYNRLAEEIRTSPNLEEVLKQIDPKELDDVRSSLDQFGDELPADSEDSFAVKVDPFMDQGKADRMNRWFHVMLKLFTSISVRTIFALNLKDEEIVRELRTAEESAFGIAHEALFSTPSPDEKLKSQIALSLGKIKSHLISISNVVNRWLVGRNRNYLYEVSGSNLAALAEQMAGMIEKEKPLLWILLERQDKKNLDSVRDSNAVIAIRMLYGIDSIGNALQSAKSEEARGKIAAALERAFNVLDGKSVRSISEAIQKFQEADIAETFLIALNFLNARLPQLEKFLSNPELKLNHQDEILNKVRSLFADVESLSRSELRSEETENQAFAEAVEKLASITSENEAHRVLYAIQNTLEDIRDEMDNEYAEYEQAPVIQISSEILLDELSEAVDIMREAGIDIYAGEKRSTNIKINSSVIGAVVTARTNWELGQYLNDILGKDPATGQLRNPWWTEKVRQILMAKKHHLEWDADKKQLILTQDYQNALKSKINDRVKLFPDSEFGSVSAKIYSLNKILNEVTQKGFIDLALSALKEVKNQFAELLDSSDLVTEEDLRNLDPFRNRAELRSDVGTTKSSPAKLFFLQMVGFIKNYIGQGKRLPETMGLSYKLDGFREWSDQTVMDKIREKILKDSDFKAEFKRRIQSREFKRFVKRLALLEVKDSEKNNLLVRILREDQDEYETLLGSLNQIKKLTPASIRQAVLQFAKTHKRVGSYGTPTRIDFSETLRKVLSPETLDSSADRSGRSELRASISEWKIILIFGMIGLSAATLFLVNPSRFSPLVQFSPSIANTDSEVWGDLPPLDKKSVAIVKKAFARARAETGDDLILPPRLLAVYVQLLSQMDEESFIAKFLQDVKEIKELGNYGRPPTQDEKVLIDETQREFQRYFEEKYHLLYRPRPVRLVSQRFISSPASAIYQIFYDRFDFIWPIHLYKKHFQGSFSHENFHANSVGFAPRRLNEGMTEYLTIKMMMDLEGKDSSIKSILSYYPTHLKSQQNSAGDVPFYMFEVVAIASLVHLFGEEPLLDAYFRGDYRKLHQVVGVKNWKKIVDLAFRYDKQESDVQKFGEELSDLLSKIRPKSELRIDEPKGDSRAELRRAGDSQRILMPLDSSSTSFPFNFLGVMDWSSIFRNGFTMDGSDGWSRTSTIPFVGRDGYENESAKSLSPESSIREVDRASRYTDPFLTPFGTNETSWPSDFRNWAIPEWRFSSTRNRNLTNGNDFFFLDSGNGVMDSRFYRFFIKGGKTPEDFLNWHTAFEQFKHGRNRDSGSSEYGSAMRYALVDAYITVQQFFHLVGSFSNRKYSTNSSQRQIPFLLPEISRAELRAVEGIGGAAGNSNLYFDFSDNSFARDERFLRYQEWFERNKLDKNSKPADWPVELAGFRIEVHRKTAERVNLYLEAPAYGQERSVGKDGYVDSRAFSVFLDQIAADALRILNSRSPDVRSSWVLTFHRKFRIFLKNNITERTSWGGFDRAELRSDRPLRVNTSIINQVDAILKQAGIPHGSATFVHWTQDNPQKLTRTWLDLFKKYGAPMRQLYLDLFQTFDAIERLQTINQEELDEALEKDRTEGGLRHFGFLVQNKEKAKPLSEIKYLYHGNDSEGISRMIFQSKGLLDYRDADWVETESNNLSVAREISATFTGRDGVVLEFEVQKLIRAGITLKPTQDIVGVIEREYRTQDPISFKFLSERSKKEIVGKYSSKDHHKNEQLAKALGYRSFAVMNKALKLSVDAESRRAELQSQGEETINEVADDVVEKSIDNLLTRKYVLERVQFVTNELLGPEYFSLLKQYIIPRAEEWAGGNLKRFALKLFVIIGKAAYLKTDAQIENYFKNAIPNTEIEKAKEFRKRITKDSMTAMADEVIREKVIELKRKGIASSYNVVGIEVFGSLARGQATLATGLSKFDDNLPSDMDIKVLIINDKGGRSSADVLDFAESLQRKVKARLRGLGIEILFDDAMYVDVRKAVMKEIERRDELLKEVRAELRSDAAVEISATLKQGTTATVFYIAGTEYYFDSPEEAVRELNKRGIRAHAIFSMDTSYKLVEFVDHEGQIQSVPVYYQNRAELRSVAVLENDVGKTVTPREKNVAQTSVPQIVKDYAVYMIHALYAYGGPSENSRMYRDVTWKDKLINTLVNQPTLSTSTIKKGDTERNMFAPQGLLLKGGVVEAARPSDIGSFVSMGGRITGIHSNIVDSDKGKIEIIGDAIQKRGQNTYNEFSIRKPEIAGFYVYLQTDEESGFTTPAATASHEEIKKITDEIQIPVYVMKKGVLYEARYSESKKSFEIAASQKDIKPDDIIKSDYETSETTKQKLTEELSRSQPMKLLINGEEESVLSWDQGRMAYLEINLSKDPRSFATRPIKYIPKEHSPQLFPEETDVQLLTEFPTRQNPEARGTVRYFTQNGKLYRSVNGYNSWAGIAVSQMWHDQEIRGFGKGISGDREGIIGIGPLQNNLGVPLSDNEAYVDAMKQDINKWQSSPNNNRLLNMLAMQLYGFGEQARKFNDRETQEKAFRIASSVIPEGRYRSYRKNRLGDNGELKIDIEQENRLLDLIRMLNHQIEGEANLEKDAKVIARMSDIRQGLEDHLFRLYDLMNLHQVVTSKTRKIEQSLAQANLILSESTPYQIIYSRNQFNIVPSIFRAELRITEEELKRQLAQTDLSEFRRNFDSFDRKKITQLLRLLIKIGEEVLHKFNETGKREIPESNIQALEPIFHAANIIQTFPNDNTVLQLSQRANELFINEYDRWSTEREGYIRNSKRSLRALNLFDEITSKKLGHSSRIDETRFAHALQLLIDSKSRRDIEKSFSIVTQFVDENVFQKLVIQTGYIRRLHESIKTQIHANLIDLKVEAFGGLSSISEAMGHHLDSDIVDFYEQTLQGKTEASIERAATFFSSYAKRGVTDRPKFVERFKQIVQSDEYTPDIQQKAFQALQLNIQSLEPDFLDFYFIGDGIQPKPNIQFPIYRIPNEANAFTVMDILDIDPNVRKSLLRHGDFQDFMRTIKFHRLVVEKLDDIQLGEFVHFIRFYEFTSGKVLTIQQAKDFTKGLLLELIDRAELRNLSPTKLTNQISDQSLTATHSELRSISLLKNGRLSAARPEARQMTSDARSELRIGLQVILTAAVPLAMVGLGLVLLWYSFREKASVKNEDTTIADIRKNLLSKQSEWVDENEIFGQPNAKHWADRKDVKSKLKHPRRFPQRELALKTIQDNNLKTEGKADLSPLLPALVKLLDEAFRDYQSHDLYLEIENYFFIKDLFTTLVTFKDARLLPILIQYYKKDLHEEFHEFLAPYFNWDSIKNELGKPAAGALLLRALLRDDNFLVIDKHDVLRNLKVHDAGYRLLGKGSSQTIRFDHGNSRVVLFMPTIDVRDSGSRDYATIVIEKIGSTYRIKAPHSQVATLVEQWDNDRKPVLLPESGRLSAHASELVPTYAYHRRPVNGDIKISFKKGKAQSVRIPFGRATTDGLVFIPGIKENGKEEFGALSREHGEIEITPDEIRVTNKSGNGLDIIKDVLKFSDNDFSARHSEDLAETEGEATLKEREEFLTQARSPEMFIREILSREGFDIQAGNYRDVHNLQSERAVLNLSEGYSVSISHSEDRQMNDASGKVFRVPGSPFNFSIEVGRADLSPLLFQLSQDEARGVIFNPRQAQITELNQINFAGFPAILGFAYPKERYFVIYAHQDFVQKILQQEGRTVFDVQIPGGEKITFEFLPVHTSAANEFITKVFDDETSLQIRSELRNNNQQDYLDRNAAQSLMEPMVTSKAELRSQLSSNNVAESTARPEARQIPSSDARAELRNFKRLYGVKDVYRKLKKKLGQIQRNNIKVSFQPKSETQRYDSINIDETEGSSGRQLQLEFLKNGRIIAKVFRISKRSHEKEPVYYIFDLKKASVELSSPELGEDIPHNFVWNGFDPLLGIDFVEIQGKYVPRFIVRDDFLRAWQKSDAYKKLGRTHPLLAHLLMSQPPVPAVPSSVDQTPGDSADSDVRSELRKNRTSHIVDRTSKYEIRNTNNEIRIQRTDASSKLRQIQKIAAEGTASSSGDLLKPYSLNSDERANRKISPSLIKVNHEDSRLPLTEGQPDGDKTALPRFELGSALSSVERFDPVKLQGRSQQKQVTTELNLSQENNVKNEISQNPEPARSELRGNGQLSTIKMVVELEESEIDKISGKYGSEKHGFSPSSSLQDASFIDEVQSLSKIRSTHPVSFENNLADAEILIIGPGRTGDEVRTFVEKYPEIKTIHIVDGDSSDFVNIDRELTILKNKKHKIPQIFGYQVNALEMPKELIGKIDLIYESRVFDPKLFTKEQLIQAAKQIKILLKSGGVFMSRPPSIVSWVYLLKREFPLEILNLKADDLKYRYVNVPVFAINFSKEVGVDLIKSMPVGEVLEGKPDAEKIKAEEESISVIQNSFFGTGKPEEIAKALQAVKGSNVSIDHFLDQLQNHLSETIEGNRISVFSKKETVLNALSTLGGEINTDTVLPILKSGFGFTLDMPSNADLNNLAGQMADILRSSVHKIIQTGTAEPISEDLLQAIHQSESIAFDQMSPLIQSGKITEMNDFIFYDPAFQEKLIQYLMSVARAFGDKAQSKFHLRLIAANKALLDQFIKIANERLEAESLSYRIEDTTSSAHIFGIRHLEDPVNANKIADTIEVKRSELREKPFAVYFMPREIVLHINQNKFKTLIEHSVQLDREDALSKAQVFGIVPVMDQYFYTASEISASSLTSFLANQIAPISGISFNQGIVVTVAEFIKSVVTEARAELRRKTSA